MPPAELRRLFDFAFEPFLLTRNLFDHLKETLPPAFPFEQAADLQAASYDALWIDVGGEG
jgi:hypothetical protein